MSIRIVPISLPTANAYVATLHRHHAPIPPGFPWFCVGAVFDEVLCGVAIGGRPTNRNNDDKFTVEVLRVATDGTPHAPSALLGACARAAKALGAERCITYTLEEESGISLRAAGWQQEKSGISSAWMYGNTRTKAVARPHMDKKKIRWAIHFGGNPAIKYSTPHEMLALSRESEPRLFDVANL